VFTQAEADTDRTHSFHSFIHCYCKVINKEKDDEREREASFASRYAISALKDMGTCG